MGNKLSYPGDVRLSGKVVVVTGGNTGIGYETAKGLVQLGAHTFIACRSKERAEAAIERMKNELGPKTETAGEVSAEKEIKLEYLPLDLSSFQSTKDFVRAFKEKNLPLHILINNAALGASPYSKTSDGFESLFQVNHLSHMLLTLELLPIILETAASSGDGRIIFVSSSVHTIAQPFDPNKLNPSEEEYRRMYAYCNTKLHNVMTGFALQRRLQEKYITVSSLHPGYVETELKRSVQDLKVFYFLQSFTSKVFGRTPVEGAATTLNCAVNPELNSQHHFYYDSCRPKEPSIASRNEGFQEQLWAKSFEFLKDHLSPETVEKYGPSKQEEPPPSTDQVESQPEDQPPLLNTESKPEDQRSPPSTEQQAEDKPEDQLPAESQLEDHTTDQHQPEDHTTDQQEDSKPEDQPPTADQQPSPDPRTEKQAEGKPENQPLNESRSASQQEDSKPEELPSSTDQ